MDAASILDVHSNAQLTGTLPSTLGTLPKLAQLVTYNCSLTGDAPAWLTAMPLYSSYNVTLAQSNISVSACAPGECPPCLSVVVATGPGSGRVRYRRGRWRHGFRCVCFLRLAGVEGYMRCNQY